jgi:phosphatidyl-myo-inositol dimannoside synthase
MSSLLVTSDFPPAFGGGISRYCHSLCLHSGGKIGAVAPALGSYQEYDARQPFPVFRRHVPMSRTLWARLLQAAILGFHSTSLARRKGTEALLFGHWYLGLVGPIFRKAANTPFFVFLYGGELDRFPDDSLASRWVMWALGQAKAVIVISEHTREEYLRKGGKRSHTHKLCPGVDTTQFTPNLDAHHILERHGLRGCQVLLTVSRLVERKGHDTVIRALPRIVEQFPEIAYLIVGTGPMEPALRELARQCGVAGHVVFAGQVPDQELPAYYNACDLFVMPSRQIEGREGVEGFGIVYLEAAACGKPTIGGRSGGVGEAVIDGYSGFLIDPTDAEGVASRTAQLLRDTELASRLGANGRSRAETEFSWSVQTMRLQELLNEA